MLYGATYIPPYSTLYMFTHLWHKTYNIIYNSYEGMHPTSSGHPIGFGDIKSSQGLCNAVHPWHSPSGSSVDTYTKAPLGIRGVPSGPEILRFWTISAADILTSYIQTDIIRHVISAYSIQFTIVCIRCACLWHISQYIPWTENRHVVHAKHNKHLSLQDQFSTHLLSPQRLVRVQHIVWHPYIGRSLE